MKEKEELEKILQETLEKQKNQFETDYNLALKNLKAFFPNYSIKDILESLLLISLWLRNISSQVKLQLAYMIFVSMKEEDFTQHDVIDTYEDFKTFTDNLKQLLPEFPMFEDYVPETDWGEIRYFHNDKLYKMFYGNNFDGIYEYLDAFNLTHSIINKTYLELIKRSPIAELENVLSLQQNIINTIENNSVSQDVLDIHTGNMECPDKDFWQSNKNFYESSNLNHIPSEFLKTFSCKIGDVDPNNVEVNIFLDDFHEDKNFRFMCIEYTGIFYPILPRRFLSMLVESWGDIFQNNKKDILEKEPRYKLKFDQSLANYIFKRTKISDLYNSVSPFDKICNAPSESIYSCAFTTKNKLYLVYLLNLCYSEIEVQDNLNDFSSVFVRDMEILKQNPTTILLRTEKENNVIGFRPQNEEAKNIEPTILTIMPRISFSISYFGIPNEITGHVLSLEDFLGIIDEIGDIKDIEDFFDFLDKEKDNKNPLNTVLDMYGAYKDSVGILISGARNPTHISLAPGWGSNFRYDSLKKFWNKYPTNHLFSHPRTYEIVDAGNNLIRLVSKNIFMSLLHIKINLTDIYINGPFEKMSWEHGRIANLLMEIIQDGFNEYKDELSKHPFFAKFYKIQIFIFPYVTAEADEDLSYLKHLDPKENLFKMDRGYPKEDVPSIRLSFNYEKVYEQLSNSKDRQFEINLITIVIRKINEIVEVEVTDVVKTIEEDSSKPPRFKINIFDKPAAFPEFEKIILPEHHDFKAAKKSIAQMAFENGIKPGDYSVEEAKNILNKLKKEIVNLVNIKVSKYNFSKSIGYLISKTDALNHKYEMNKLTYEASLNQEVNYSREERYSENHTKYIKDHKNYRYLIEKFVQLTPSGLEGLSDDDLKELLAIVDWLHVIQTGSDMIHYSLAPTGITVDEDFRVDVNYNEDFESKEKSFGIREAAIDLETAGNPEDRSDSTRDTIQFLDNLDKGFSNDLGFSLHSLNSILQVLKLWPNFNASAEECSYYTTTKENIFEVAQKAIESITITKNQFDKIIDFLTLKREELLIILDQSEPCEDLPIWEHNKRPMRYNLKPLIRINDEYVWGAYSTRKTQEIWIANTSSAMFPYEIKTKEIRKLLSKERGNISEGLNIRAEEIIKRYTKYYRKNCELHKIEKRKKYPTNLGDYDVLALIPESNIVLNVECKDLEPPFCVKDARRLRERFFGRDNTNRGYFEKVLKRENFLKKKSIDIMKSLNWTLNTSEPLEVESIFVIRRNYWWTSFPPFETDVKFLRIDMLDDFLKGISNKSKSNE